jgi:hypothetical protein
MEKSWDEVVNIEKLAFERGEIDGTRDAEDDSDNSKQTGFAIGYKIGIELGMMREFCENYIRDSETSSDWSETGVKSCRKVLDMLVALPSHVCILR